MIGVVAVALVVGMEDEAALSDLTLAARLLVGVSGTLIAEGDAAATEVVCRRRRGDDGSTEEACRTEGIFCIKVENSNVRTRKLATPSSPREDRIVSLCCC